MSPFRFDMFVAVVVAAAVVIVLIYAFMLAVPRNDDEHTHNALSQPGHMKTHLLRKLVQFRRRFTR